MKTTLFSCIFFLVSNYLNAQAGTLDSSFGKDGIVATDFKFITWAHALTIQPDGKIIVVGGRQDGVNFFQVIRYLKNGRPDVSFGKNGKAAIYIQHHFGSAEPFAVGLQKDGKILIAGEAQSGDNDADFALVRLNPDGTPDSLFGEKGSTTANLGYFYEKGRGLAIQRDGKIIVTGWGAGVFETVRFKTNGLLDSSFGSNGSVTTSVGNLGGTAYAVALEPDEKIVVSGTVNGGFGMVRYLPNGNLDSSFGVNGSVFLTHKKGDAAYAYAMTIQPDGKIILGGNTFLNYDAIMVRYKTDGSIDSSFGVNGLVLIKGQAFSYIYSLCLQRDNKIIAAGSSFISNNTGNDYSIWRFNANGNLDSSFANNGVALVDYHNKVDEAYGVAIAPDDKIVVTGFMSQDFGDIIFGTIKLSSDGQSINANSATNEVSSSILSVYPNPASNILTVKGLFADNNYQLKINNSKGDIVLMASVNNNTSYEVNVQNLSNGVYYLTILSNQKTVTVLKFIKE